jgi:hypothetical protein
MRRKTTDTAKSPLPPKIAVARARTPRHLRGKKPKNNYLAENALSDCDTSQTSKRRPGAPPGNLNAVALPHRTPEQIAFYRRYARFMKTTKAILAVVRAGLKKPQPQ